MKTVFLASVAVATLMAAPAMAQDVIGSAGIAYVGNDIEGFTTDGARLDGVAAFEIAPAWTVTTAADISYTKDTFGDYTRGSAEAHLTKSFANDIRAGGFLAITDIGGEENVTVGAEVQKYYASTTLTAVASYTDFYNDDMWSIGADASYYINPSMRLNAGVNYATLDTPYFDMEGVSYGAGAEYQFANSPFSVSGQYVRSDIEGLDIDQVSIGVRYNFGGTLQAQDRAGANLGRTMATAQVF